MEKHYRLEINFDNDETYKIVKDIYGESLNTESDEVKEAVKELNPFIRLGKGEYKISLEEVIKETETEDTKIRL